MNKLARIFGAVFVMLLIGACQKDSNAVLIGHAYSVTDPDGIRRCDWTFKKSAVVEYDYGTQVESRGKVVYGKAGTFDTVQLTTQALGETITYRVDYLSTYITLWPIESTACFLVLNEL